MMESREKELWVPYSHVVIRNTIKISIYYIQHVSYAFCAVLDECKGLVLLLLILARNIFFS